jgi:excinuclease UvrABC ATPase subunit
MSTVATVTEVAHYLRLLYARAATPFCPKCDLPIGARAPSPSSRSSRRDCPPNANLSVWAPVVRARKGLHGEVIERARKAGIEPCGSTGSTTTRQGPDAQEDEGRTTCGSGSGAPHARGRSCSG